MSRSKFKKEDRIISEEELKNVICRKGLSTSSRRRKEIAVVGCELRCLKEKDVLYIYDEKNSIQDVERLFKKRKDSITY